MLRALLSPAAGPRLAITPLLRQIGLSSSASAPGIKVALVGRPNVGKSTLFNRLTRSRAAIVHRGAGTTRDRKEGAGRLGGLNFSVVDTGGLQEADEGGALAGHVNEQAAQAVREADLVFFVVDGRAGVQPSDVAFARWLRRTAFVRPGAAARVNARATGHASTGTAATDDVAGAPAPAPAAPGRPSVRVLVNKAESGSSAEMLWGHTMHEAEALGWGTAYAISAEHGEGLGDIATLLVEAGADDAGALDEAVGEGVGGSKDGDSVNGGSSADGRARFNELRMAVVGRPNVGKSTLVNALVDCMSHQQGGSACAGPHDGEGAGQLSNAARSATGTATGDETRSNAGSWRVIASELPGTTRDSVTVRLDSNHELLGESAGVPVLLVDTAGIRRHGRRMASPSLAALPDATAAAMTEQTQHGLERELETLSVQSAERAIADAHVAVLVVDAEEGHLTKTDLVIARKVLDEGRALVIVANKVDLFHDRGARIPAALRSKLDSSLVQAEGVPVLLTAAVEGAGGTGVRQLMPAVTAAWHRWRRRVSTAKLNRWLQKVQRIQAPPTQQGTGKAVRLRYMTQIGSAPPRFTLFVNRGAEGFADSYIRFLVRQMRTAFGFKGLPITIQVQNRRADERRVRYQSAAAQRRKGGEQRRRGGAHGSVSFGKGSATPRNKSKNKRGGRFEK
eukprot:g1057.t1